MCEPSKTKGLDLIGLGKIAEAIPASVYERSAESLFTTFEKLTAPITESTSGLGRYLRQKFDNMVDAEKAIATYTVEKAILRAKVRCEQLKINLQPPAHPKTFVRTIEESSKETDPLLHEMWVNLLASQLSNGLSHPHFVETLCHFSPAEAKLLVSLLPESEIGDHQNYMVIRTGPAVVWAHTNSGNGIQPWTISCELLYEFRFAHLSAPVPHRRFSILFRTDLGKQFLEAVSNDG